MPPKESAPNPELLRVWLLEDHDAFRRNVLRLLGHTPDIQADHAFSSAEALLEQLNGSSQVPPQVLLLDLGLPGMSGLDVIREVTRLAPDCRIIVLTVFEDEDKISRALTTGACGYLLKTAQPDEIIDAIRQAADGGTPMSPRVARSLIDILARLTQPATHVDLSPREREMLKCLVDGLTNKEIATRMDVSPHTVDSYARTLFSKLKVRSRASAVARALKDRLV
jgi:DNA-binding NarL/FixJ family response regulator